MGHHELRLLKFAIQYAGWHTYHTDQSTVRAVRSLANKDLILVNDHRQFRLNTNEAKADLETQRAESKLIRESYPDCKCPDCAEDIPDNVVDGQACKNCEHAFFLPEPVNKN